MAYSSFLFIGFMLCALQTSCGGSASPINTVESEPQAHQHLSPCPASPNCHCSEDQDSPAWIAPLVFDGEAARAWTVAQEVVAALGGDIVLRNDTYLHAVFTSSILRFKDDLELRLEPETNLIHVRSGSRVGYSDFGVNRRRIERLRRRFAAEIK